MRISVAMATRNGAKYIGEQVRSILAQGRLPDEIVISDDASDDSTLEEVRKHFDAHSMASSIRLRVIANETPLGVASNFESALVACTGDIVVLCDQDDSWHPERISRIEAMFADEPAALLIACDARLVDESGNPLGDSLFRALGMSANELRALQGVSTFAALMRRNLVTGATTAVRRELVAIAVPFPTGWLHDEWLAVNAAIHYGVRMIPQRLVDYRQHDHNEIGVRRPRIQDKIARLVTERGERNERLLQRAEALHARLSAYPEQVPKGVMEAALAKLEHETVRASLPRRRLARLAPVLVETVSGRYRRSGRGVHDVVRDLVQPAHSPSSG